MSSNEKRYDPRDTTLKFVTRPDDLDPLRKPHYSGKTSRKALKYSIICAPVLRSRPVVVFPLAPEEGDRCLRAEMSCGHAVTPESLTGWCRSLLDQVWALRAGTE
ncbi:unnamed protein product [Menidia menidia]|uniref:(Atlantic silverside) hypothetical protein n=1 Tax=Menidia menidia TaxID=238744 RepID=A0A8S4AZK1_9TELE|nr:unnamed protein product [Menidia menidia]